MGNYKLSSSSTLDFVGIYKFGKNRFGNEQAKKYLISIENILIELAENPYLDRDASMFAHNLKYYNFRAQVIFYIRDSPNTIYIVRVLGSRMNFIEHL